MQLATPQWVQSGWWGAGEELLPWLLPAFSAASCQQFKQASRFAMSPVAWAVGVCCGPRTGVLEAAPRFRYCPDYAGSALFNASLVMEAVHCL